MSATGRPEGECRSAQHEGTPVSLGDAPLVELRAVSKRFVKGLDLAAHLGNLLGAGVREEVVHAVDRVDLAVRAGEVVGLVGESGCGKSTVGRLAVGLLAPSEGERYWRGEALSGASPVEARLQQLKMQMIFQDPYASLNPRLRVVDIVGEAPVAHGLVARRQQVEYVGLQLNRVGLDPSLMRRFAHQFSGGQRARIGIARALAVKPEFLVCDESVAALDVSIQAQVLNLFMELRAALNLTYLFISHDLGVVEHISDRVVIMYLGRVVETGPTEGIFASPRHPYTQALLKEVGKVVPGKRSFVPIRGEIPSPLDPPPGCHFHPRCPHALPRCTAEVPRLIEVAPGRRVACHLALTMESPR
jgi:peptide/nickel transport system ATP-binding protein